MLQQSVMAHLSLIRHFRKIKIFSFVRVRNIRTEMAKVTKKVAAGIWRISLRIPNRSVSQTLCLTILVGGL